MKGFYDYNPLYWTDAYKIAHKAMLAKGTTRLAGTEIPRSLKYAPLGIKRISNFGKTIVWKFIHDAFNQNFFNSPELEYEEVFLEGTSRPVSYLKPVRVISSGREKALKFAEDMSKMLGAPYDGEHFEKLWDLGYLPIEVRTLKESAEVLPNIPTSTFINTVDGFAWLSLYLEVICSELSWKPMLANSIAKQYARVAIENINITDPENVDFYTFMCHDFSARGLNPHDCIAVGIAHAAVFRGSDELIVIPAVRNIYGVFEDDVVINSVSASEHSVTCTQLFYYLDRLQNGLEQETIELYYSFDVPAYGSLENPDLFGIAEYLNLKDWLQRFPTGILSYVCDTFDTWRTCSQTVPRLKKEIMERDGKFVLRGDSGDPVNVVCGNKVDSFDNWKNFQDDKYKNVSETTFRNICESKGMVELMWDCFNGTISSTGYKILDSHIGVLYGDSITPERQLQIYKRLIEKQFAVTNAPLGVGSFTYAYNTRDSIGLAYKGSWFEILMEDGTLKSFDIYKDPITDDGTKKSLKGLQFVYKDETGEYCVESGVSEEKYQSEENELKPFYRNGKFLYEVNFSELRKEIIASL